MTKGTRTAWIRLILAIINCVILVLIIIKYWGKT